MRQLNKITPNYLQYGLGSARNLIIALLIQGVFNDQKLEQHLEWYGYSLTKESDYREYLVKLAKNKILPVLKEVIKNPDYQLKIEKERYIFFKSKEIFRRCMYIAYDLYGWDKKSI